MVKSQGQGHSTIAPKSLFLAKVVISCHIADLNVFLNKSISWTIQQILKNDQYFRIYGD